MMSLKSKNTRAVIVYKAAVKTDLCSEENENKLKFFQYYRISTGVQNVQA